ncbi:MAG: hypothetical protein HYY84_20070 [Deltaproteobacteria bacterium]|nr:hypothetical protein [Deltaproteobacteria bacterium]
MRATLGVFLCVLSASVVHLFFSSPAYADIVLTDARGDTRNTAPGGDFYRQDAFDITELRIAEKGADVLVTATFAARVPLRHNVRLSRETTATLFPMNIEIYIDQKPLIGFTRTLPGRRVEIARESAWDVALVLTPQPREFAGELRRIDAELADRTHFAAKPRVRGRTVSGRFPRARIGELTPHMGFVVLVTPAAFRSTFQLFGEHLLFIADVRARATSCSLESPDSTGCAFGGCKPCGDHPRVIDAIVAKDANELELFGAYSRGRFVNVPARVPKPPAPKLRSQQPPIEL